MYIYIYVSLLWYDDRIIMGIISILGWLPTGTPAWLAGKSELNGGF